MLVDLFSTDRLTGDVFVEKHPVYMDENVRLGNQYSHYIDAKDNGLQDITQMPNGKLMAGDVLLETAELAVPFAHLSSDDGHATAHTFMTDMPMQDIPIEAEDDLHDDDAMGFMI